MMTPAFTPIKPYSPYPAASFSRFGENTILDENPDKLAQKAVNDKKNIVQTIKLVLCSLATGILNYFILNHILHAEEINQIIVSSVSALSGFTLENSFNAHDVKQLIKQNPSDIFNEERDPKKQQARSIVLSLSLTLLFLNNLLNKPDLIDTPQATAWINAILGMVSGYCGSLSDTKQLMLPLESNNQENKPSMYFA